MDYAQLKRSVESVRMPEEMKRRVSAGAARTPRAARKGPVAAALAACLALAFSVPVLAANVEPAYNLLYLVSPAAAQYFQPVRMSDEDNGIRMEVAFARMDGNTLEVLLTAQDLGGGRIDAATSLNDSYTVRSPFDASAHCEFAGYDEETKTAAFLVSISRTSGQDIPGGKVTFSVRQFVSGQREYAGVEIASTLAGVSETQETQRTAWIGAGGPDVDAGSETADVLVPGEPDETFPVDGISLTGLALVDGRLHVQIAVSDPLNRENYGFVYLETADGGKIDCTESYTFTSGTDTARVDYTEFIFPSLGDALEHCALLGDFWTSGVTTNGDWKVTFPLEPAG